MTSISYLFFPPWAPIHILRERVANRKNVFTHNPWGEYGHEEHVLVYRVLKTLQTEFHYDIWFSNYCSNRSVHLMNHYISGFVAEYECLPVNLTLVHEIAEIYRSNECWTWYEDYQWFEQECLMREVSPSEKSELELLPYGHNFVYVLFAESGCGTYCRGCRQQCLFTGQVFWEQGTIFPDVRIPGINIKRDVIAHAPKFGIHIHYIMFVEWVGPIFQQCTCTKRSVYHFGGDCFAFWKRRADRWIR